MEKALEEDDEVYFLKNYGDEMPYCLMCKAAQYGSKRIFQFLHSSGVKCGDCRNSLGCLAVRGGHIDMISYLYSVGVNWSGAWIEGILIKRIDVLEYLHFFLSEELEIEIEDPSTIFYSIDTGNVKIVEYILAKNEGLLYCKNNNNVCFGCIILHCITQQLKENRIYLCFY